MTLSELKELAQLCSLEMRDAFAASQGARMTYTERKRQGFARNMLRGGAPMKMAEFKELEN